jgi:hypothetical protein
MSHFFSEPAETRECSVDIPVDGQVSLRFIPFWRSREHGDWLTVAPWSPTGSAPMDAVGHRDHMAARNAVFGGSAMSRLIRVVKHLIGTRRRDAGKLALASYHLESLALEYYIAPAGLSEAVAEFVHFVAEQVVDAVPPSGVLVGGALPADAWVLSEWLSDLAAHAEAVLVAADDHERAATFRELFELDRVTVAPLGARTSVAS